MFLLLITYFTVLLGALKHHNEVKRVSKMAKRPLGLAKASKTKKQKKQGPTTSESSTKSTGSEQPEQLTNELTVELNEEVNPDDPLSQLEGLWKTWLRSERDNELILNGIIHECDRIIRNCKENGGTEEITLTPGFYSIYGLSLADLAQFHTLDEDIEGDEEKQKDEEPDNISDFFDNALERIENGLEKFTNDPSLLLAKSKILLLRIPLEFISKMTTESTTKEFPSISKMLNESIESFESAVTECESKKTFDIFYDDKEVILDVLNSLDDLLDIIDNFGKQHTEGLDSDKEPGSEDDDDNLDHVLEAVELSKKHPLFKIQNTDKYNTFWREAALKQYSILGKENKNKQLLGKFAKKLGQSYLMEAEGPISIFTTLEYDSDNDAEDGEINGLTASKANEIATSLVSKACEFLKQCLDEEDPQSWVDLAEAEIALGNLRETGSESQEEYYKKAEKRLKKANNATHGKYEDILNNLLQQD